MIPSIVHCTIIFTKLQALENAIYILKTFEVFVLVTHLMVMGIDKKWHGLVGIVLVEFVAFMQLL